MRKKERGALDDAKAGEREGARCGGEAGGAEAWTRPQRGARGVCVRHMVGWAGSRRAAQGRRRQERRSERHGREMRAPARSLNLSQPQPSPHRDKRRTLHGGLVPLDPMTPDIHAPCSKRAFDGQVRKWRRMLHAWFLF